MSTEAERLARRLTSEGEKTRAFFSSLPEEIWQKAAYTDGASWRVQQILAHIVEVESSLPRLFKHIAEGGRGVPEGFDLNDYNEKAVVDFERASPQELVALFTERRERTVGFVGGLSEEDLSKQGQHPFLGQAPLREMIRLFYLHVQIHIRDVRALF